MAGRRGSGPPDYTRRAARWLLGATAHPGGEALTRELVDRLALRPGARVVDVACGDGATLALLSSAGHRPVGVDLEPRAVAAARRHAPAVVADAHALPLASGAYDAVISECAVSTFADPARALAEMARVLRPGGRVGFTDVVLDRSRAAPEVTAAVDRLTTAGTLEDQVAAAEHAGLRVLATADRSDAALALTRRLARRFALVGARGPARTARACEAAVRAGALGYALLVAQRR